MEVPCIECDKIFTIRGGTSGSATRRCGKCYLEWQRERRRKKNDKKVY
tara:strand:+ start:128 stop:271 length:144 start_codon:yes stop_codon:yes gene_type:complete